MSACESHSGEIRAPDARTLGLRGRKTMREPLPLEFRLLDKIDFTQGDCWQWIAGGSPYGRIKCGDSLRQAHRVLYEMLVGPIPDGLQLDHLCQNQRCVNPAHLEPVSLLENIMRGDCWSATNTRKTHCKHGHPFSGDNLYIKTKPNGRPERVCRACARIRARKRTGYNARKLP